MATLVYQGLQSCLESQLVEPKTLWLKLSSQKPHFSQPFELDFKSCFLDTNTKELEEKRRYEEKISKNTNFLHDNKHISSNLDLGGWSFLQALSPSSQAPKEAMETTKPYVHPLVKRTLSEKSLELCTENLGSETGTDITEDSIFSLSSSDPKGENSPTREQQKSRQSWGAKKGNSQSYPPPLTTISGLESLQVRSHREDGRLIVKAIQAPSPHTIFHAERSHGRLRLSFFKDIISDFDSNEVTTEENEASNEDKKEKESEEEEEDFQEQEDEEENDAYFGDEEMDGNSLADGAEMGMENLQRLTGCKGGECENKTLLNWEPFWVATS